MIEIRNLRKYYHKGSSRERLIFNNLNFQMDQGGKVLVTGDNGIGKTTLLKIIALLDKNYEGTYCLFGNDVKSLNATEIARLRNEVFGFIFQEFYLLEDETAYDNVIIPLIYSKKFKKNMRKKRVEEMAKLFGIEELLLKKVKYMSGGERQKIVIMRALINDPEIIMMDEPTSSLNHENRMMTMHYVDEIARAGKSIVIVSHDDVVVNHLAKESYQIYNMNSEKLTN